MRELPKSTVTFLFTDIEGSTRLLHELGKRYAEVPAEVGSEFERGYAEGRRLTLDAAVLVALESSDGYVSRESG
jgi:hypothetical protein